MSPPSVMTPHSTIMSTSAASVLMSPPCAMSPGDEPPSTAVVSVTTAISSLVSSNSAASISIPTSSASTSVPPCAVSSMTIGCSSIESSNVSNACAMSTCTSNESSEDTPGVLQTCAMSSMTGSGNVSQTTAISSIDSSNLPLANSTQMSSAIATFNTSGTSGVTSADSSLSSMDTCNSSLSTVISSAMADSSVSNTSGRTCTISNTNICSGSIISAPTNSDMVSTSCNTSSCVMPITSGSVSSAVCASSVPSNSSLSSTKPPFISSKSCNKASNGSPTVAFIPTELISSSNRSAGRMTSTNSTTIPISNSDISLQISSCNVSVQSNLCSNSVPSSSYQVLTISNVCPTSSNISTTVSVTSNRNSVLNSQNGTSVSSVDSVNKNEALHIYKRGASSNKQSLYEKVDSEKRKLLDVSNGEIFLQELQLVVDNRDEIGGNSCELKPGNTTENVMVSNNENLGRLQNFIGETQNIQGLKSEQTSEYENRRAPENVRDGKETLGNSTELVNTETPSMRHSNACAFDEKPCESSIGSCSSKSILTTTDNQLANNCGKIKPNRHCIPLVCDLPSQNDQRSNNGNTNVSSRLGNGTNVHDENGQEMGEKCVTNVIHHVKKLEISASFRENREFGNFEPMRNSKRKQIERKYSARVNNGQLPKSSFGGNVENAIENFENRKGMKNNTPGGISNTMLIPRQSLNRHINNSNMTEENNMKRNNSYRNGFEFETTYHEQSNTTGKHYDPNNDVASNSLSRNSHFNAGSNASTFNTSEMFVSNQFPICQSTPIGNFPNSRGSDFSEKFFNTKDFLPQNCPFKNLSGDILSGDCSNFRANMTSIFFNPKGIPCEDFPSISSDASLTSFSDESTHLSLLTPHTGPSSLSSTDLSINTFASNVTVNTGDFQTCHRFNRCIWKTSQKTYYFSYPLCHTNRAHCIQSNCCNVPTFGCTTQIRSRTARKVEKSGATDLAIPVRKDVVGAQVKFCKHSHPNVYAMNLFVSNMQ
uniref:Uncharacterized protein n=1 Tax=Cacopsylla melanoneura TaxID=428564 RepID=A0A8D8TC99_9HEMI